MLPTKARFTVIVTLNEDAWQSAREWGKTDQEITGELRNEITKQIGRNGRLIADIDEIEKLEVE